MDRVAIVIGEIQLEAEIFDTPTGMAILQALPLSGKANLWGNEIYFPVPLQLSPEADAVDVVGVGDLAYWPEGKAFCIFFGPTPVSKGEEIRAYGPVNVFGRIKGHPEILKKVPRGAEITVRRLD